MKRDCLTRGRGRQRLEGIVIYDNNSIVIYGSTHDISLEREFLTELKMLVEGKRFISSAINTFQPSLNSGNASYHSVQNIWSSRLLSKGVKIRIHKTIILPVVLYGYEAWSLTLFGPKKDEDTGEWRKLHKGN
jgi:hypothetical protein